MTKKRVIISVVNDLVTDRRVDKTAKVLVDLGFDVMLTGRHKHDSLRMPQRTYTTNRMRLLFERGPVFYAEFNLRLFFHLLFNKADLLVSNDLDTLLPNFIISRLKRIPIVYDSHEYYTETPELTGRLFAQGIWKRLERMIVPRLADCITVSSSISGLYKEQYGIDFRVVRNIAETTGNEIKKSRSELGLPEGKKLIILQGAGINLQRGAEEAILSMQFLDGSVLLIVGSGDRVQALKDMVKQRHLTDKVVFIGKQTPENLFAYTANADLGLSLDKDTNINYRYSLPNKLFDYIQAGIPVLASPLPEVKFIIEHYQIGDLILTHDPKHIAEKMEAMFADQELITRRKDNLKIAKADLSWEKEKQTLVKLFSRYA